MVYRLDQISMIRKFLIFSAFFIFWHGYPLEKYSLISDLPNGNLYFHEAINDIHILYDVERHDLNVYENLKSIPATIHFHYGPATQELCMHIAQTMCKNKQVFTDLSPEMAVEDSIKYSSGKIPRVSLITSLYNADEFVVDFMRNIVEQTIFPATELIIINACSPGNEEKEILPYLQKYPNITYIRLAHDPGLYAIWNLGARYAHAPLIGNANLDDRRDLHSLSEQVSILERYPQYDLAYCDYCVAYAPNPQWYDLSSYPRTNIPPFSKQAIRYCLPGPQPIWRKSMHEKHGYFRDDFTSAADQEMWCRAVNQGSEFIKIDCVSGIYYINPKGISTDTENAKTAQRNRENFYIGLTYSHLWS